MELLIHSRQYFFPDTNDLLFANPCSGTPLTGYKVMDKYANKCGAKNPKALTSTRLRKHLATMSQLFNMTSNDMEQLAAFMGHTLGVHQKSYRLPDDIYQTAKMSKLLLIMEKGGAAEFKGKSLEEVELNMDADLLAEDLETNSDGEDDNMMTPQPQDELSDFVPAVVQPEPVEVQRRTLKKGTRNIEPWSIQQKQAVAKYFRNHINLKKPPKRQECEALKAECPIVKDRQWEKIKVLVQNMYLGKCKIY
uniref:Nucleoside diphosphate kinase n=1 Tax=Lygus hesperus TaxID=30085 RepID=A0A0A9YTF3_LYGHE